MKDMIESKQVKRNTFKYILNFIIKVSIYSLGVMFSFALLSIILVNLRYNVSIRISDILDKNIIKFESIENIMILALAFLAFVLFNVIVFAFLRKLNDKFLKVLSYVILTIMSFSFLFFSYYWNKVSFGNSIADSHKVLASALNYSKGQPFSLWYFLKYPWQLGLMGYEFAVIKLFNIKDLYHAEFVFKIINIVQILASFLMLHLISKRYVLKGLYSKKFRYNPVNTFLMFINLPVIMLTMYIYGDWPTLFFSLSTIILVLYALEKRMYSIIAIASVPMLCALLVRQNSMIIFIAITLILIYEHIKVFFKIGDYSEIKISNLNKAFLVVSTIIFISFSFILKEIAIKKADSILQIKKEIVEPVPLKNHLALGLNENDNAPGWYNVDIAKHAEANAKIDNEFYSKYIKDRFKTFAENPKYAVKFFTNKLAVTWADPTYNAMHYNVNLRKNAPGDYREFLKDKIKSNSVINDLYYGSNRNNFELYSKLLVIIVSVFSMYYCIYKLFKKRAFNNSELLIMLIFVGGFIYQLLFETKARYIIIYNIIIMPIALAGISVYFNSKLQKFEKDVEEDEDKKQKEKEEEKKKV